MSYILRPRARADLREISEYIADRNPDAGRTWLRSMVEVFELLGDYPALGHLRDDIRVGLGSGLVKSEPEDDGGCDAYA